VTDGVIFVIFIFVLENVMLLFSHDMHGNSGIGEEQRGHLLQAARYRGRHFGLDVPKVFLAYKYTQ